MELNLWTYVPTSYLKPTTSEASLSAPDMAAWTSGCTLQNRTIELWLSSNGKAMQRPLSWRGWLTRPWVKRLSGTIFEPLTLQHGAAAFISSLPAIHANPSAMPAGAAGKQIRVTFGQKWRASSTKPSPNGSGVKTLKDTCPWDTPTSQQAYAAWATRQRQDCSRREKLVLATAGAGSSSWPTPTASDAGYVPDMMIEGGRLKTVSPIDISEGSGGQFALNEASRSWTTLWSLLKAMGWSAATATSLSSHPVRVSFKNGKRSFLTGLTSNPRFYEMIMGWPIGWTAPGEQVTAYAAWLRRSRGRYLSLLTSWTRDGTPNSAELVAS